MAVDAGRERVPTVAPAAQSGVALSAAGERRPASALPRLRPHHPCRPRSAGVKHKTQVFVFHEGDHYRTRLTHTLEVAQIARSLARSLALDEDLAEALALAHDLGHPPFGHAGEESLDPRLAASGGFDHNGQTLRVVTRLEARYAEFDGLNLTWETLEGLVKHNGPLTDAAGVTVARYQAKGIPDGLRRFAERLEVPLSTHASAEAQAAAIADDIAYDAHDLDDGLRAGLFELDALVEVPLIAGLLGGHRPQGHRELEPPRRVHEVIRRLITRMIEDVVAASDRRLAARWQPAAPTMCGAADATVVAFSAETAETDRAVSRRFCSRACTAMNASAPSWVPAGSCTTCSRAMSPSPMQFRRNGRRARTSARRAGACAA